MISFLRKIFRRDRRVHKRPMLTAITVFVIFLIAASVMFVALGIMRMSSEYPKVSVGEESSGFVSSGMSVNLSYIPSTNLVWDPSFENYHDEEVFNVAETDGNQVYLQNKEEGGLPTGVFKDGKLRILSFDESGQLRQVVHAGILDCQTEQLGILRPLGEEDRSDLFAVKVRRSASGVLLLLQSGEIVSDTASPEGMTLPSEGDSAFADVAEKGSRYFAVTENGSFYYSPNGVSWDRIPGEEDEETDMKALTILGKTGIACGKNGKILVCDSSSVIMPSINSSADLLTACSDDTRALIAGTSGYVCTTVNGNLFRQLTSSELLATDSDEWVLSAQENGEFILVDRTGKLAVGAFDTEKDKFVFDRYDAKLPNGISPAQVSVLGEGNIWLLTNNGLIYAFSRTQNRWHQVFTEIDGKIDAICHYSEDSVLISHEGKIESASVYTRVTIDQPIAENSESGIQKGSICLLSASRPSVSESGANAWDVFGTDTKTQIVSDAPKNSGEKSLRVSASKTDPGEAHFISQVISRDDRNPLKEKVFYHVRLWIKQTNMEKEEVLVWISGLSETIGTTFTNVSGSWKEYSFTFAWPSDKKRLENQEIRLNIGFYGNGEMYADGIRLQRESYSEQSIKPAVVDLLSDSHPEFLRLENLQLGCLGWDISSNLPLMGNEHIAVDEDGTVRDTGVISLESTLRLVKKVDAKPWFVIDSSFGAEEMETLLGYISGGITDTYGKLRVDNGTAVPWNKQFENIVLEFGDRDGLFSDETHRKNYVDYMISLVVNSKYYSDLKDKLVFIDGMEYRDSATLPSSADYHVSSLNISNSIIEKATDASVSDIGILIDKAYSEFADHHPRNTSYNQDALGEWIGNLSFSIVKSRVSENQIVQDQTALNAAEIAEFLLHDLGNDTSMVAVDLPISRLCGDAGDDRLFSHDGSTPESRLVESSNMETAMRLCGVLSSAAKGQRVDTVWTAPLTHKKDENYSIGLKSYAYTSDGYIYLIVTNPTKEQQQFLIEAKTPIKNVSASRYSATGEKISLASTRNFLNGNVKRYTLQPGQILVAKIPV
ncbi:MAG: carbohydrate binding domain-containing protein [Clostridiales bacterium]|nr:carbohydrate binding domain-containing protein [Clostridiales bacterium]